MAKSVVTAFLAGLGAAALAGCAPDIAKIDTQPEVPGHYLIGQNGSHPTPAEKQTKRNARRFAFVTASSMQMSSQASRSSPNPVSKRARW